MELPEFRHRGLEWKPCGQPCRPYGAYFYFAMFELLDQSVFHVALGPAADHPPRRIPLSGARYGNLRRPWGHVREWRWNDQAE